MKKLFVLFAIAGALVACNNDSETTTTTDSTNVTTVDSLNVTPAPPVVDTMNMNNGDTTKVIVDSTNR